MTTIDQRIVEMQFNNQQFEKGVKTSMGTIDELKGSLNFDDASKSLDDLARRGNAFSLSGIADSVESIADKFGLLGAVGFTVIQNLTNQAMGFAAKVGGFLLEPLISGGERRAQQIQQAKFQFEGLGMDIEATMASALAAVKGTAYGLGDAAMVAAQMGASGMRAGEDMTRSLRAVAGVAAMTGRGYAEIGQIFTTVAGNGRLMGDQLNQLSYKGINAAAVLGKYLGKSEAAVREMVTKGKIDFKTFSAAMDGAFGQHAQDANKLFSGALANMQAALSRIGAEVQGVKLNSFRDILNALTPVIDKAHESMMPFINAINGMQTALSGLVVTNLTTFLNDPKKWEIIGLSMEVMAAALGNISKFGKAAGEAFQFIFPAKTTQDLLIVIWGLRDFLKNIEISTKVTNTFKYVLEVVLSIFKLMGSALGVVIDALQPMIWAFKEVFPDVRIIRIHELAVKISKLAESLQLSGDAAAKVKNIFKGVFSVVRGLGMVALTLVDCLISLAGGFAPLGGILLSVAGGLGAFIDKVREAIESTGIFNGVSEVFAATGSVINGLFTGLGIVLEWVSTLATKAASIFRDFFRGLADGFGGFNFEAFAAGINGILGGGALVMVLDILKKIREFASGEIKIVGLSDLFTTLQDGVNAFKDNQKSQVLLNIAKGVLILAAALFILASIEPERMASAITTMALLFAQLIGSLKLLTDVMDGSKMRTMVSVVATINGLATAILILAVAMKLLSTIDWNGIAKGVVAIAALTAILVVTAKILSKNKKTIIEGAGAFVLFAIAIDLLTVAVKALGELDWAVLSQGLVGIGILGLEIATFSKYVENSLTPKVGLSILLIAGALNLLAFAIEKLGTLDDNVLGKGLMGIAGVLAAVAIFSKVLGKTENVVATAWALVLVAGAILVIGQAIAQIGGLDQDTLVKGLFGLGAALLMLALGMKDMEASVGGAFAMVLVAGAITVISVALKTFSEMSWGGIIKSLAMLAGVFVILGIATAALTPLIVPMLGLAGAIALIGLGCALAGAGLLAISAGITALAASGVVGTTALIVMITALISMVPMFLQEVGRGIVMFLQVLASSSAAITQAVTKIILSVLESLILVVPKLVETIMVFLETFITAIVEFIPFLVNAGMLMLLGVLKGIADNIGQVTSTAIDIVVNFINAVASKLPDIIQAGFNFVISFINGLANAVRDNNKKVIKAVDNLLSAFVTAAVEWVQAGVGKIESVGKNIVEGFIQGVKNKISDMGSIAKKLGAALLGGIKKFLGIESPSKEMATVGEYSVMGLVGGLKKFAGLAAVEAKNVGRQTLDALSQAVSNVSDIIDGNLSLAPTIRPVVDLTDVEAGASKIGSLIGGSPGFKVKGAVEQASSIATGTQSSNDKTTTSTDNNISFVQNNYSPKELSRVDIYRQTKNQISTLKGLVNA